MKSIQLLTLATGLIVSFSSFAAAPANAPAGSTGLCKDGTYYSGAEKKGACRGHKGVKEWWAEETAGKQDTKADAKTEPKSEAKAAPAAAKPAPSAKTEATKPAATPAPGGGPGLVWVNETSKVYHCQGDKWYGKTKHGEYMSEADAMAKGFKGDHGKACVKS
jgi:hypothetical protein